MLTPVQVFRDFRSVALGNPRRRPITILEIVMFVVLLAAFALVMLRFGEPVGRAFKKVSRGGGRFGFMLVMAPFAIVVAIIGAAYARWRERGTEPFPFPMIVRLWRWRIYRREGDERLYLTDGRGLMCLVNRPTANETVEQVLDALDPDSVLEVDDETRERITFELPGEPPANGMVRRLVHPQAFVFVLTDNEHLLDDLGGVLDKARARQFGQRPQKWRPLESPAIAAARLRR